MLKNLREEIDFNNVKINIKDASFPAPFKSGLEYSSPARGTWNIVHTGMLVPEAHEIFVCPAGCLRGVVLTAAEMKAEKRFSTVEVKENNLFEGNMEDLIIEGVTDIINKLPKRPPCVLIYTSCVHHFAGCDLKMIYNALNNRFPDIDFSDCYMNPIMRKSGSTPDELMRIGLYKALKKRPLNECCVSIIGSDLETDKDSELIKIINNAGFKLHEITSKRSYEDYQEMAESSIYFTTIPAAKKAGTFLENRLGGKHIYLPFSYNYEEIDAAIMTLCDALGVDALVLNQNSSNCDALGVDALVLNQNGSNCDALGVDALVLNQKKSECDALLKEVLAIIKDTEIAIDYTFCYRPLSLARLLLDNGYNVKYVFADSFTGEEKEDFEYLKEHYPNLTLSPTVHAKMRFYRNNEVKNVETHSANNGLAIDKAMPQTESDILAYDKAKPQTESDILAIGQKAAYFLNTNHFVNIVEGGGMWGYEAIIKTLNEIKDAYLYKKDMRSLVQIKGMGCDYCV